MSKKKLAGIIAACAVVIIVAILLVIFRPWRPPISPLIYSLSVDVSPSGAGLVSPLGGTYGPGVQVTLTASPANGYRFVNWTGDVRTVSNVNSALAIISMNDDYSITANFALEIIEIRDWYDLDAVRENLGGSYLLMNGLDSTIAGYMELASKTANGGMGWEPIGTSGDGFTGSFNGQGYEIRDLFINRPDQDYVGLFAHISWMHPIENVGVIENVGLVNADVTGYRQVGALVGDNSGIVNNSYSTCSVTSGWSYVGGLVGYNDGGFVSNSYSASNVTGFRYVGGLVGGITGTRAVREGTVINCYSTSSVTGFTRTGGLVASIVADGNVSNSYFAGSVNGTRWVGGLVAENYGGNVSNSYSTGNVTGRDYSGYVGGVVGLNLWGSISSCYSTGTVSGKRPVGSLVGENSEGTVNNSFWDTETSGQATSDGGTGKATAEMQDIDTFTDTETEGLDEPWDITAIAPGETNDAYTWNIVDGQTYPFLSWQS
ncbi:MAG: hypothetical protein OEV56_00930 [Dehalococcoidia bacterium]|nr:hypothetical protein [Dehalococcoidia bacterium]